MGIRTDVPVRECMSQPVETVSKDAPLQEAARKMREKSINALVLTESRSILTSTDIVSAVADGQDTSSLSAGDITTDVVATVDPGTTLTEAASIMLRNNCSHLPVVNEGDLVGMLSQTDIAKHNSG